MSAHDLTHRRRLVRDADTAAALQRIYKLLRALTGKVDIMAIDIGALTAKVEQAEANEAKAAAVIQSLRAEIASLHQANTGDTSTMQAAIDALAAKLDGPTTALSAALGTDAAATDPATADPAPAPADPAPAPADPAPVAAVPQPLHPGQPTPGVLDGNPNLTGTAASQQVPPADAAPDPAA